MKRVTSFLLAFIVFQPVFSQQFTLSTNTYTQVAYVGFDNQVSCTVEGVNNKSIVLATENGEIVRKQRVFIYRPSRVGDSKIIIHQRRNGQLKKIGEHDIMVREFPKPKVVIGGVTGKEIDKGTLLAQTGIGCYYAIPGLGFNLKCSIDSFSVSVLRDTSMLFYKKNAGNVFVGEVVELLKSLRPGDIILLSGITYMNPDQIRKNADPVEYVVK